uniref:Uncharacterized protein n=1 Tax=Heliothis virescens TaxID=7102 RepID=A0A2A4JQ90_HELVI
MPVMKRMKGLPKDLLAAEGLMYHDWSAITPCQRACATRFGIAIQREQESYLTKHPEILALCKIFIAKMTQRGKRKDFEKEAAENFTRPFAELDEEIRTFLESPEDGPYVNMEDRTFYEFDDEDFQKDLKKIFSKYYPPEPWSIHSPEASPTNTLSSSFLSIQTSEFTLPTPEPIPTPEPTISEVFYKLISNTVDKVIYVQVDESTLIYDTAYVELMRAVEQAMEIPVIEIRADIAALFKNAYHMFEIDVMEKERYAAEIAWEKRMRKKLKKTLRRQKNFKGYETPPTPKSQISSHESYKKPPPRPCECHPLANYNRYGKDRFGIYLPRQEEFSKLNITTTPACSAGTVEGAKDDEKSDVRSIVSKKSTQTNKSATSTRRGRSVPDSDGETKSTD